MGGKRSYSSKRIRDKPTQLPTSKPSDYSLPNPNASSSTNLPVNPTTEPRRRIVSNGIGFSRDGWVLEGRQPGCILERKLSNDTLSHILVEDNLIVLGIPINSDRSTISKAQKWKTNGVIAGANYQPASFQPAPYQTTPYQPASSYLPGPSYQPPASYQPARGFGTQDVRFNDVMENLRLGAVRSQASRGVSGAWSAPATAVGSFAAGISDGEHGNEKVNDVEGVKEDQEHPANGAKGIATTHNEAAKSSSGESRAAESEGEVANHDLQAPITKTANAAQNELEAVQATKVDGEAASEVNGGESSLQSQADEGMLTIRGRPVNDGPKEADQQSVNVQDQTVESGGKQINGVEEQLKDVKAGSGEAVKIDTKQNDAHDEGKIATEGSTDPTAEASKLIKPTTELTGESEQAAKDPVVASGEPASEVIVEVEKDIDSPEGVIKPAPSTEPQEEKGITVNEDDIDAVPVAPKDAEQPIMDFKEGDDTPKPSGPPEDIKASEEGSGDPATSELSKVEKNVLISEAVVSDTASKTYNNTKEGVKDPEGGSSDSVSNAIDDVQEKIKDTIEERVEPAAEASNETEKDVIDPKEDSGAPVLEEPKVTKEAIKVAEEVNDNPASLDNAEKDFKGSEDGTNNSTTEISKDAEKEVEPFTGDSDIPTVEVSSNTGEDTKGSKEDNNDATVEASNITKEDTKGSKEDNNDATSEAPNNTKNDTNEPQQSTVDATPSKPTNLEKDIEASTASNQEPTPTTSKSLQVTNPPPTPNEKDTASAAAAEKAKYPLTPIPLTLFKNKPSSSKK